MSFPVFLRFPVFFFFCDLKVTTNKEVNFDDSLVSKLWSIVFFQLSVPFADFTDIHVHDYLFFLMNQDTETKLAAVQWFVGVLFTRTMPRREISRR